MTAPKLDELSTHLVPFDMAAWARGRKLNPTVRALILLLRNLENAQQALDEAEHKVKQQVEVLAKEMEERGDR